ncbi:MAG: DUF4270 domain-containing protein [Paludibacteraceae bacterium]|nr:DUF4270 domain-containing protein [Paludibacteraceae bacterium]
MNRRISLVWILIAIACCWTACKDDVASAGKAVLGEEDEIIVLVDTFPLTSAIDSCDAIISQADSFLLGEIETEYGMLRASVLTQLACPEGFLYPQGAVVDSVCLFMYYSSCVGDKNAPLAINAYLMDKGTFTYSGKYYTDLTIDDYCSRAKPILTNHHIVVASERFDSIMDENGSYIPMMRMRVNDDFMDYFWTMQSFSDQDDFNEQFHGLLIESSFGSSTVLNVSDIALGVYYHFDYSKAGKDTTVYDMKAFYANSEVRTVNHLSYPDRKEWIEKLQQKADSFNYIIAPAGAYTRITFPMARMTDSIMRHMVEVIDGDTIQNKQPYVNKAEVRINVMNVYSGSESAKTRNDWLQPASYMLLIKEESMQRFFDNRELPSDTCALLSALLQGQDSQGEDIYYYTYDLSDFLTNQLRQQTNITELKMLLVPVTVNTGTGTTESVYSSVRQQQTMSATKILSAQNGMKLEIVYSGFALPVIIDD